MFIGKRIGASRLKELSLVTKLCAYGNPTGCQGLVDPAPQLAEGGLGSRPQPDHEVLVLVDGDSGGVAPPLLGEDVVVDGLEVAVQVVLVIRPGNAGLL